MFCLSKIIFFQGKENTAIVLPSITKAFLQSLPLKGSTAMQIHRQLMTQTNNPVFAIHYVALKDACIRIMQS
jgi:DNA-binding FadR family transcriptional regulator